MSVGRSESSFHSSVLVQYYSLLQARSNHNGKIDADLGGQVKKYAMSCFMPGIASYFFVLINSPHAIIIPDIKAEIVEAINIEWVKSRKHPLLL